MEAVQHTAHALHTVVYRIQSQHRVPRAVGQPLQQACHDAVRVVGGMVGLKAAGQRARLPDGRVAVGGDGDLPGRVNQVHIAHKLGCRRDHLGGKPPAETPDGGGVVALVQQPLPQLGHCPVLDFVIDRFVHVVLDDTGDLVLLIGDGGMVAQVGQGQVRHHHLGRHPFFGALGGDARQGIPRLDLVRLGQDVLDRLKLVHMAQQLCFEYQKNPLPCSGASPPYLLNTNVLMITGNTAPLATGAPMSM